MASFNGYLNAMAPPAVETKKAGAGLFAELGILSPAEKRKAAQEQMMAQQMMQMQMAQQNRQMQMQRQLQREATQASSRAQGGALGDSLAFPTWAALAGMEGTSAPAEGIGNFMGMLADRRQQQSMQEQMASMQPTSDADSIASQIVTKALADYPDDHAKAFGVAGQQLVALGQTRGDMQLATIGANLMRKQQEAAAERAELEATQTSTKKTKFEMNQQQRGTPFDYYDEAGNQVTETPFYDEEGNYVGDRMEGRGMPAQRVRQDLPEDDDALNKEFRAYLEAKDSANQRMDFLLRGIDQGAAQGWAGTLVNFMNNAQGTFRQFVPELGDQPGQMDHTGFAELQRQNSQFEDWAQKTGVSTAVWRDLISIQAKSYNPTGTITEKDVRQAAESVGGSFSDPKTVQRILRNAQGFNRRDVETKYQYLPSSMRGQAEEQYNTFNKRWGHVKTEDEHSSTGKKNTADNPAKISTEEEYNALGPGDYYIHPTRGLSRKR